MLNCFAETKEQARPIIAVRQDQFDPWYEKQQQRFQNWCSAQHFKAKSGEVCLMPNEQGHIEQVILGLDDEGDSWAFGALPKALPEGDYYFEDVSALSAELQEHAAVAWGLGSYQFTPYKKQPDMNARLVLPETLNQHRIENRVQCTYLIRDLINTPTEDLGPAELAEAAENVAEEFGAKLSQIVGDDLLEYGYPAVHTVGRASSQSPRLIDLRWGSEHDYKVTLVGKGVCFDSGGLDLKPPAGMQDMKKDMGGAAQALGVARAIMASKLPVNLRLLIPAVENAVSGDAYRPGDIIHTRKGTTVEVTNTDAEGRLILCDALTEAVTDEPNLLIDFATLTGAARVALGPDVSALFTRDDTLAHALTTHGEANQDPVWRLPLYTAYRDYLKSQLADIANAYTKPYGGAITAALFLEEFVPSHISWAHFDIMASNMQSKPGRPEGGEAMAYHAVFSYIMSLFG